MAALDRARPLRYRLPEFDLTLEFLPTDFVQVNAGVNAELVSTAVRLAGVEPTDRVLDLYCGLGNFSLPLAQRAAELLGVEGEAGLVARAVRNAAANGIGNARFVTADLTASDWSFYREHWDVVVLDPPRTGAEAPVAELNRQPAAPHRLRIVPPRDARARRASARGAARVQAAGGARFRHVPAHASHRIPRAVYARLRRQSRLFAAIIAPCRVRSSASSCRRATRGARSRIGSNA